MNNKGATSRWGWNPKDMRYAAAFAAKEMKNCSSGTLTQSRTVTCVMVNQCLTGLREGELRNAEKELKSNKQYVEQNNRWQCEIRSDPFGSFKRGIRWLMVTLRIILQRLVGTGMRNYGDS